MNRGLITRDGIEGLDLAILTFPPLSLDQRLRLRTDLVAGGAPGLDLVSLTNASVTLAHEVAEHGICLFARTAEDEVDFVTRARARLLKLEGVISASTPRESE